MADQSSDRGALVDRAARSVADPRLPVSRDRAAALRVLALLEASGWGDIKAATEAQDAVIARQAAALIALSQDPGGDLVSRRDIEARHGAVANQIRAALARSRTEVDRLRGLLAQACDEIDDIRGTRSAVAAELRKRGGITPTEEETRG